MLARLSKMIGQEVGGVPTVKLLRRLEECSIPSDKPQIVSMLEVIDEKLEFDLKNTAKAFEELNAVPLLYHIMEQMKKDGAVAFLAVQIFIRFEKCPALMLIVVELGGLSLLEEMLSYHSKNKFLAVVIPDLIRMAKEIGTKQAVIEINNESQSLEFCSHCQEIAQRRKDKELNITAAKRLNQPNAFRGTIVPTGCERINKATFFMREYALSDAVQIAALDAVIVFARSGDARDAIKDTIAIEAAGNALENFPANEKIVWRAALLFSLVAKLRQQYAMGIIMQSSHDLLARNFPLYRISPYVQQTILWMINNMLLWPRSKHEIQRSEVCMTLLNTLDYRHAAQKEIEMNKLVLPVFGQVSPAYQIIIPLKVQEFMRETKGAMLKVDKEPDIDPDQAKVMRKRRAKLNPKPRYGDVNSKLFQKGEPGLTDTSPKKFEEARILSAAEAILQHIEDESHSPQRSPKKSANQEV